MSKHHWMAAVKRILRRPAFVLVSSVLLLGALGINGATSALRLHFRKLALSLRANDGLAALPREMKNWVVVPETRGVDPDMVHNLGTDKYLFRSYVDTAATGNGGKAVTTAKRIAALAELSMKERYSEVMKYRATNTNSVLDLALTYYTGKADTVPHVPDRCYVADGFQPSAYELKTWNLGTYSDGTPRTVVVRFIDFEDQTARALPNRCVAYFFHANGAYEHDPNRVRARLQDLREQYAYFAKIEVMTTLPPRPGAPENDPLRESDREAAAAAMRQYLTLALPEIEKLLPDWNARAATGR